MMEPMVILKTTARSAPIPTVAGIIVYFIFPKIIETNQSETVLILVSLFTFLIVLTLIIFGSLRNKNTNQKTNEGNSITDVETESGDVFIGTKGTTTSSAVKNKIKTTKTKSGDVFIGSKK